MLGVDINKQIYMLDCFRDRLEFPRLIQKMSQMHEQMRQKYVGAKIETLIEDASSGTQAIQQLRMNNPKSKIVPIRAVENKVSRLVGVSSYIENETCLFPVVVGYWWQDFKNELLLFPNSIFKDQCDALSQGIEYATTALLKSSQFYWGCVG